MQNPTEPRQQFNGYWYWLVDGQWIPEAVTPTSANSPTSTFSSNGRDSYASYASTETAMSTVSLLCYSNS